MAANGPPEEEERLLNRVRRWFSYYTGGFFRPLKNSSERPDAGRPEENGVVRSPPLPPYEEEEEKDAVGVDDVDVLQVAQPHRADGAGGLFQPLNDGIERPDAGRPEENGVIHYPPLPPYEEEEEIDVVGMDDEDELQAAQLRRAVEDPDGHGRFDNSRGGEEREERVNHVDQNARPPSPPPQQFPPPNFGMDWRQQDHIPVNYPAQHAYPHAFPFAPFAFPPFAFPPAPFLNPAPPPAFFNAAPSAFLNPAPPAAFFNAAPPPFFNAAPPPFFNAAPPPFFNAAPPPFFNAAPPPFFNAAPPPFFNAAPPSFFNAAPPAFLNAAPHPDQHAPPQAEAQAFLDDYSDDEMNDADEVEDVGMKILEIETIGPLSSEESLGFFSSGSCVEEDPQSPSTSGFSSSTKRSREENDEEQAASKRPRWSDESDSD